VLDTLGIKESRLADDTKAMLEEALDQSATGMIICELEQLVTNVSLASSHTKHASERRLEWGGPLCFEPHEVVFAKLKPDLERLLDEGTDLIFTNQTRMPVALTTKWSPPQNRAHRHRRQEGATFIFGAAV
jgi:hypothetical protein